MAHDRRNGRQQDGLIEGLLRSDVGTIRALYDRHFPAVQRFVQLNSGTERDAQDVFQEAITVLWLNAKEGRVRTDQNGDLGGYIHRVARNKWLDMLRSAEHKRERSSIEPDAAGLVQEPVDQSEERLERLRTIYAALDEKCRAVLDRFYYEGQDLATIARAMGVEVESIRTIKYRCMMKLRAFRATIAGEKEAQER